MKSFRSGLLEVLLKKIIPKLLMNSEKDFHYGEWWKQSYILKSLPVMVNFLEFFQELNENNFQHKEQHEVDVSQA